MSNRIKDFSTVASSPAGDDYLPLDGNTNGVRRIRASTLLAAATTTASVDTYGAIGNGTADDTAAITAALAAVGAAGGVITFTPGKTYKTTSPITVPTDNTVLWGYGATITGGAYTQVRKFVFDGRTRGGVYGLRFAGLYVSGPGGGLGDGVVHLNNATDLVVRDCEFNDVIQSGVTILANSAWCKVLDCTFTNNFAAIFSDDDTHHAPIGTHVRGNRITGSFTGSYTAGVKFSGLGSLTTSAKHVICGNRIEGPMEMGIEIQTWINDCVIGQNAIAGTAFGISVSDCARVTVTGNTLAGTTYLGIECSGAQSVTVAGNTVTNPAHTGYGLLITSSALHINASGNTVTGFQYGVYAQNSSHVSLTGGNEFRDSGSSELVYFKNMTDVKFSGNRLVAGATTYGFLALDSNDADCARIMISDNQFAGTVTNNGLLYYSPANHITDVWVWNNVTAGMHCPGGGVNVQCPGGNAADRLLRLRHRNNLNYGFDNQDVFNFGVDEQSASMPFGGTNFWYYFFREGGLLTMDASGGARTIGLPPVAGLEGYEITIAKSDSSGNTVTIDPNASETINGATTLVLAAQYRRATLRCDGLKCHIVQSN